MGTDLAVIQHAGAELTQWRSPEAVLAEAQQAATALVKVVDMKKNKVVFNNETYLEFEDWQTVGKFYGCTTKVLSTNYVEFGDVHGFEATAVVLDRNQNEIGRVESMCLSDEENWGMVPKYGWEDVLDNNGKKIWDATLRNGKGGYKAKKVKIGESPKPLFQLRSMAQTRASAKALKSIFSWVVVLAGYRPQVAEEMTGQEFDDEHDQTRAPVNMPKSLDDKKPDPKPAAQQPPKTAQTTSTPNPAPAAELEEMSGEIVTVTPGKNGVVVLNIAGKVVVVPGRLATDDLIPKAKVLLLVAKVTIKGQHMFEAREIKMAVPPVEDVMEGEIIEPGATDPVLDEARAAGLSGLFDENPSIEAPEAPAAEGADKPGTAGLKRAKRLHTLITQNHKNVGFTEEHLKKYLATQRLEHARDLACPPKGSDAFNAYEYACSMAVGETDYHEVIED